MENSRKLLVGLDLDRRSPQICTYEKEGADIVVAPMRVGGDADLLREILDQMEAQGRGAMEILSKQAQGFMALVNAASGDPQKVVLMMIADRLPELVKTQVEAVKGINIDKVTVWDGSGSADGKTSTANFISGLMKSIPPMEDLFKMAGMQLPDYLKGKDVPEDQPKAEEQSK